MLNKKSVILKLLTSLQKDPQSNREKQNKTTANKKQTENEIIDVLKTNKEKRRRKKQQHGMAQNDK